MVGEVSFTPIGIVRTPFSDRTSTPRQPYAAREAEGAIELFPGRGFEHALADLEGWDRITGWSLHWLHLNAPARSWRPKVLPPLQRREAARGLLDAVAAPPEPHRPLRGAPRRGAWPRPSRCVTST